MRGLYTTVNFKSFKNLTPASAQGIYRVIFALSQSDINILVVLNH